MVRTLKNVLINVIGALACFILFSIDPFLSWMVGRNMFLLPFWAWGLIGVLLFEVAYIVFFRLLVFKR